MKEIGQLKSDLTKAEKERDMYATFHREAKDERNEYRLKYHGAMKVVEDIKTYKGDLDSGEINREEFMSLVCCVTIGPHAALNPPDKCGTCGGYLGHKCSNGDRWRKYPAVVCSMCMGIDAIPCPDCPD